MKHMRKLRFFNGKGLVFNGKSLAFNGNRYLLVVIMHLKSTKIKMIRVDPMRFGRRNS